MKSYYEMPDEEISPEKNISMVAAHRVELGNVG